MGFFRKQFRKVIQWENDNSNTIVWKYPLERKEEIMRHSQLVVREGQKALFIQEGRLADVFAPGTYDLGDIKNIPVLTALFSWKYAFESPYTGDIYFISTKQFIDNKWGTGNPVMMRDKDFGMIRVRGYGTYSFQVKQPTDSMKELFGSMSSLTVQDVDSYFKKIITSVLSNCIAEAQYAALDLAMHYDEISDAAKVKLANEFDPMGIEIKGLYVENLSLPEEVEKMIDKRTSVGVLGDSMNAYAKMEGVGALRDAAKNPGGMSGSAVGLGAGVEMGKMFAEAMRDTTSTAPKAEVKEETIECPACHAQIKKGSKFCPECGAKASIPAKKFCTKCGTEVKPGAKFCPECGEKIN